MAYVFQVLWIIKNKISNNIDRHKNEMLSEECSGRPILFFIKENWICAMTKHHAESSITEFYSVLIKKQSSGGVL